MSRHGRSRQRYTTTVEDGTVYVGTSADRIEVGDIERVLDHVGGPAWQIEYSERQKRRYPDLDTSDEGLVVDVVDVINAMTLERSFVETLAAQPREPHGGEGATSPRVGMFVGRLVSDLQYGVD